MCKTHHHHARHDTHASRPAGQPDQRPQRDPGTERVSDPEREQITTILQAAAADGLLSTAELEQRLTTAWHARTRAELSTVTADLQAWSERRQRAIRQAAHARTAITVRRYSLAASITAMLIMTTIWLLSGAGYAWPIWPALGLAPWLLSQRRALRTDVA